jgi:hypothetical protein
MSKLPLKCPGWKAVLSALRSGESNLLLHGEKVADHTRTGLAECRYEVKLEVIENRQYREPGWRGRNRTDPMALAPSWSARALNTMIPGPTGRLAWWLAFMRACWAKTSGWPGGVGWRGVWDLDTQVASSRLETKTCGAMAFFPAAGTRLTHALFSRHFKSKVDRPGNRNRPRGEGSLNWPI